VRERSDQTPAAERSDGARDAVTEGEPTPEERRALFRVLRGAPTDAELAALTVVVAALAATPAPAAPPPPRSAWNDPAARLRTPLPVGPGAWRASTWPR
jgi:acyl-CoA carboxylase epsilon subunit